jgi:hypothetical protein
MKATMDSQTFWNVLYDKIFRVLRAHDIRMRNAAYVTGGKLFAV